MSFKLILTAAVCLVWAAPASAEVHAPVEIGAVADLAFMKHSSKVEEHGEGTFTPREFELLLGASFDPLTRFDSTTAVSDLEEIEIEEAYLTRTHLPLDFTARIGRFRPWIGKALTVPRHALETIDEPRVVEAYFGHHGYHKTGADLTRAFNGPGTRHAVTAGVLEGGNGEEGALFGEARRRPTLYGHLKNEWQAGPLTDTEIGVSYLAGSRDDDRASEVHVLGVDATAVHAYAADRHVKLQAEAFGVSRSESFYALEDPDTGEIAEQDLDDARHLWGGYALLDWRFHPRWAAGARFDAVQLIETGEDFAGERQSERGGSVYLTFFQKEWVRWRVQVGHRTLPDGTDDNRVLAQAFFTFGAHSHNGHEGHAH